MARAGLFIPAEIANVPWFDDVLVDIGDSQDLMQSLSTFSARLAKQRAILRAVTPRALVLMDEVGTGTSPAEGAAIGGALLERLAGDTHRVLTGYAVCRADEVHSGTAESHVRMRALDPAEIARYVATDEPYDKAGGYALQGEAGRFVEAVEGSRSNVIGLPLDVVLPLLDGFGVKPR